MKLFSLLSMTIFTGLALTTKAQAASGTIYKVRTLVLAVDSCLYEQAQPIMNQIQAGGTKSTVSLSMELSSYIDMNAATEIKDGNMQLTPHSVELDGSTYSSDGSCEGSLGHIGFSYDGSVLEYVKDHYCPSANEKVETVSLRIPLESIPQITFKAADRVAAYDNVGNATPANDVIKSITYEPGHGPARVQFTNEDTSRLANVYFNQAAYGRCLEKKLRL